MPQFNLGPVVQNQTGFEDLSQQPMQSPLDTSGPLPPASPATFNPNPDAVRLWARFFNNIDQNRPTVNVPTQWMNFFTLLLLKQASFEWAKDFLQSPAWNIISDNSSCSGYCFSLPKTKPSVSISELTCCNSDDDDYPSDSLLDMPNFTGLVDYHTLGMTQDGSTTPQPKVKSSAQLNPSQQTPPNPIPAPSTAPPKAKRGNVVHIF